jgi:hypothetical protein
VLLLRAPDSWPHPVVAAVAMVLLGGLDLAGSFAAKEAVERRSLVWAVAGAGFFLLVFWVYMSSLEVAELSAVTFGWIVVIQVGVVLLDRFRYDAKLPPGAWIAVALLFAAQAYLILMPTSQRSAESLEHRIEAGRGDLAELLSADQGSAGQHRDEQRLADSVLTGVVHRVPRPSSPELPDRTVESSQP